MQMNFVRFERKIKGETKIETKTGDILESLVYGHTSSANTVLLHSDRLIAFIRGSRSCSRINKHYLQIRTEQTRM